ncbi:MAG TPA: phosphoribosylaminoimidazolesuccinocarboxamide synthase [Candidatus Limnocylindrales bacterium]|nr:phosphoribosylaminoimidazolesuccinocarboxamide synthase [Candidatus Limnocylindrales bacterium]
MYLRSGKVRDLYGVDAERLLLVASDRLSAFDVVLPTLIPDKGRVLTGLSRHWFGVTRDIVPNHLLGWDPADVPDGVVPPDVRADLRGRMLLCRRAEVLPIEVVVRGYLSGSGWKEYRAAGSICGVALPEGLREGDRLPEPILTPATKAPAGKHDENVDFETMVVLLERSAVRAGTVGSPRDLATRLRDVALQLYRRAAERCEAVDLILADTKFEMGLADGELILVDEVLTPDSSRFWDAATWQPGGPQPSYDKQFVRDWLERQPWDKTAPGPELPADVVAGTRDRYVAAYERITGASFERYLREDVVG